MAEVKRYDLETTMSGYSSMEEWSEGEYVLYSDHTTIVAALERRLRIAERALEIFDDGVLQCEVGTEEAKQKAEREIDSEKGSE